MKYRKRPVVIEAIQWDGDYAEILKLADPLGAGRVLGTTDGDLEIKTLEGVMTAHIGDWIIKGVQGEIYPCKNDIFVATYEPVSDLKRVGTEG